MWEGVEFLVMVAVADPGFGQGGAKNFFPRFC